VFTSGVLYSDIEASGCT